MPEVVSGPATSSSVNRLGNDLAALACRAAIEFDNLILNRGKGLAAAKELFVEIGQRVTNVAEPQSASSLLDPNTAVVLNRALGEAVGQTIDGRLEDLLTQVRVLNASFTDLSSPVDVSRHLEELNKLRTFCLAVSRHASAMFPHPFERPAHPFRR